MKKSVLGVMCLALSSVSMVHAAPIYTFKKLVPDLMKSVPSSNTGSMAFNESSSEFEAFSNTLLEKTFTLSNTGSGAVDGLVLSIDKGSIVDTTCGGSLAVNESCIVSVRYFFNNTADTNVLLQATGNVGENAIVANSRVAVKYVIGMQGLHLFNASSLKIIAAVGNKSTANFNVHNPNPYSISFATPVFAEGSISSATTCGSVLAAGETCSVFIEATPQVIGTVSANVQLSASKLDGMSTPTVPVAIIGTP